VTENGVPVAAIVSPSDLAYLGQRDHNKEAFFAVVDEIQAAFADVPEEELEREIAKAVAEARAELWPE